MRQLTRAALAFVAVAACARMAPPPGGPPDATPPRLIATLPESVVVLDGFDGWVEFQFDEVVSEGGQPNFGLGTGDLERMVLVSPGDGVPRVDWKRNRIAVKPRDGWRPNTVYRIELAPGLRDLRDNQLDTSAVITFATGGPLPTHVLTGRAVDWSARRASANALVEATLLPDSLVYRTVTDSVGRFRLGPLPEGEYLVAVTLDQDRNRRRGGREGWDTVRVARGAGAVGEVWAFIRDTLPPRVTDATRLDSASITLVLSQPVDPTLRIGEENVVVQTVDDSSSAGAVGALPRAAHDSTYRFTVAPPVTSPDSVARPDSGAVRVAPPLARPGVAGRAGVAPAVADTLEQRRPAISNQLIVRIRGRLIPGRRYAVIVRGVRAVGGAVADSVRGTVEVPLPPPVDTTKARADSAAAARRDTTRLPGDTTRTPPRDTAAVRPRR